MKKTPLFFVILALVLILGVTVAAADSDNAALVVSLDVGCGWNLGSLVGEGSVHYVETSNGQWKLSCIGAIVSGLPLESAVQLRSTPDNPLGPCFTPFGTTFKWHTVFTPSGQSNFVCQGDLTP